MKSKKKTIELKTADENMEWAEFCASIGALEQQLASAFAGLGETMAKAVDDIAAAFMATPITATLLKRVEEGDLTFDDIIENTEMEQDDGLYWPTFGEELAESEGVLTWEHMDDARRRLEKD